MAASGPRDSEPTHSHVPDASASVLSSALEEASPAWLQALRESAPSEYLIEREIGRGGMGRALAATDTRHQRPVALKVLLRSGGPALRRFVREATVTARLQHPAIVPVYEAARFSSGEPFYAMKRIEGQSLEALLAEPRSPGERLALVPRILVAAEAVAYAHSQGVIHRDLKPANVLIGRFGELLVVDWGLAKELGDGQGDEPVDQVTATGDSVTTAGAVVGTARYMAPEQASGERCGPPADVYALGALLYETLAGRPPYAGGRAAVLELLAAGPPAPLAQVAPWVPRALVAIVEQSMRRTPDERYPTAGELATDLRRFTEGQLVGAHRYSRLELVARWLRRRRLAVLSAGMAALAALAAYGLLRAPRSPAACAGAEAKLAAVWGPGERRAVEAAFLATGKPYAAESLARVAAALDRQAAGYTSHHRRSCEATIRGEQSSELLDRQIACLDRGLSRMGSLIALLAAADEKVLSTATTATGALDAPSDCARAEALLAVAPPADEGTRLAVESLRRRLDMAIALYTVGKYEESDEATRSVVDEARRLAYDPLLAEGLYYAGVARFRLGKFDDAQALFAEAAPAAGRARDDARLVDIIVLRVWASREQARYPEARAFAETAEALALRADRPRALANVQQARGALDGKMGLWEDARKAHERAVAFGEKAELGPNQRALMLTSLSIAQRRVGRLDEAERSARYAVELARLAHGARHPDVAGTLVNLGAALNHLHRLAEAEETLTEATAIFTEALGPEHHSLGPALGNLASTQAARGRRSEALATYQRSLELKKRVRKGPHADTAFTEAEMAKILLDLGRLDEAAALAAPVLAVRVELLGLEHVETVESIELAAKVALARGDAATARAEAERALALRAKLQGAQPADRVPALLILAGAARLAGRHAEALSRADEALHLVGDKDDDHPIALAARLEQAEATLAAGRARDAVALLEPLVALSAKDEDREGVGEARFALARARRAAGLPAGDVAGLAREDFLAAGAPALAAKVERWSASPR